MPSGSAAGNGGSAWRSGRIWSCSSENAYEGAGAGDGHEELDRLIPDRRGRYSFFEIMEFSKMNTAQASELLWKEAWKGHVTSDTFQTVRKGVVSGFTAGGFTEDARLISRRSGFDRWKVSRPVEGHWLRIDDSPRESDLLEEEELAKDRIRQLLRRYGLLFRDLVQNELPLLQWPENLQILAPDGVVRGDPVRLFLRGHSGSSVYFSRGFQAAPASFAPGSGFLDQCCRSCIPLRQFPGAGPSRPAFLPPSWYIAAAVLL